jgi:hypothetical protein
VRFDATVCDIAVMVGDWASVIVAVPWELLDGNVDRDIVLSATVALRRAIFLVGYCIPMNKN